MTNKKEIVKESKFSKNQLLNSNKYKHNIDLLNVLLQDDKRYSIKEVDKLIIDFMKGRVK